MFGPYRQAAINANVAAGIDGLVARNWTQYRGEPEAVFKQFCQPSAITAWAGLLRNAAPPGMQLGYGAVFIHQRPYVRFAPNGRCELGDLLLVVSFPQLHRRHAILLQAKMGAGGWPPRAGDQWTLYTTWPAFSYAVNGVQRANVAFPYQSPMSRSQYLLLHPARHSAEACRAEPIGPRVSSIGAVVEGLLSGRIAARIRWDRNAASHSHWSRTIWDLIDVTMNQPAPPRQAQVPPGVVRGAMQLMVGAAPPAAAAPHGNDGAPVEGFAVVHFGFDGAVLPPSDGPVQWRDGPA